MVSRKSSSGKKDNTSRKIFRKCDVMLRLGSGEKNYPEGDVKSTYEQLGMNKKFFEKIVEHFDIVEKDLDELVSNMEKNNAVFDLSIESPYLAVTSPKYVDKLRIKSGDIPFDRSQRKRENYDIIKMSDDFRMTNFTPMNLEIFQRYFSGSTDIIFPSKAIYDIKLIERAFRIFYESGMKEINLLVPKKLIEPSPLIVMSDEYEIYIAPKVIEEEEGIKWEGYTESDSIPWEMLMYFSSLSPSEISNVKVWEDISRYRREFKVIRELIKRKYKLPENVSLLTSSIYKMETEIMETFILFSKIHKDISISKTIEEMVESGKKHITLEELKSHYNRFVDTHKELDEKKRTFLRYIRNLIELIEQYDNKRKEKINELTKDKIFISPKNNEYLKIIVGSRLSDIFKDKVLKQIPKIINEGEHWDFLYNFWVGKEDLESFNGIINEYYQMIMREKAEIERNKPKIKKEEERIKRIISQEMFVLSDFRNQIEEIRNDIRTILLEEEEINELKLQINNLEKAENKVINEIERKLIDEGYEKLKRRYFKKEIESGVNLYFKI